MAPGMRNCAPLALLIAVGLIADGMSGSTALGQTAPAGAPAKAPPAKAAPAKAAPAAKAAEAPVKAGEAKAKAIAAAQRSYESGTKSFEAGKMSEAVGSLSAALAGGGLPSQQMAKALYYRGVAYRKQGKPAQAMSDLTTAIWVSGGLSDAERAQAIENRQGAYREAGLGDAPPSDTRPGAIASTTKAQVVPAESPATQAAAAPAAAPRAVAAPATNWQTATTESAPAPAATSDAYVPSPGPPAPALSAVPSESSTNSDPAESAPSPLADAGKSIAQAGNNIGKFFSNVFNGGTTTPAQAEAPAVPRTAEALTSSSPVMTAATPDGAPAADWSDATKVKTTSAGARAVATGPPQATASISTGAIGQAPTPRPVANEPKGKFRLQVAAVRSRAEADGLAQKLRTQHGQGLGGREPVVDEAIIGNFGTFYRVRLGPYADANEPGKLCSSLKTSGFDCLVVSQ